MRTRIALIVTFVTAVFLFAFPVSAAPKAQTTLPDFTLSTQTTITVTVAITGGQVIVVPVDLTLIAQNQSGTPDISIIAQAEQQQGIFIGVAPASNPIASIRQGLADAIEAPAAAAPVASGQGNSYRVNANANLRAGPGTNFEIIGKPRTGDIVIVVGQNNDGTWMQLDNDGWIAEFLVDRINQDSGSAPDNGAGEEADEEAEEQAATDEEDEDEDNETTPAADADQSGLTSYLLQVADIGADVTGAVSILEGLVENPLPFDQAWRDDVAAQLSTISVSLDQYRALTPVPGYEELHNQVTSVANSCDQAVDYIAGGLANPQAVSPTLANDLMQSCIIQATNLAGTIQSLE